MVAFAKTMANQLWRWQITVEMAGRQKSDAFYRPWIEEGEMLPTVIVR